MDWYALKFHLGSFEMRVQEMVFAVSEYSLVDAKSPNDWIAHWQKVMHLYIFTEVILNSTRT